MAGALASVSDLPSAKTMLSTAASVAATAVLVRTITNDLLPDGLQEYITGSISDFFSRFSTTATIVVEEYRGFSTNHIYRSADAYLGDRCVTPSTRRIRVSKEEEEPGLEVTVDRGEEVTDVYRGVTFKWVLVSHDTERAVSRHRRRGFHFYDDGGSREVRHYELRFHKKYREMVLKQYLPYVVEQAEVIRAREKGLKIHTGNYDDIYTGNMDVWSSIGLDHPATFETLAMEPEQKREIIQDLDRFVGRKEFYRRVGKAWKRGYLLYGPPGTGKSSLIAAMANHLHYHIYDLELTQVKNNCDLRTLLLATSSKSILVVEDIDCSIDLKSREEAGGNSSSINSGSTAAAPAADSDENRRAEKMTLSGLLNVIDGLWSSCGEERIIIFTTNYKDRLDPALLRPGRMDVHIHMSYCTPAAFSILLTNYFPDEAVPAVPQGLQPLLAEVDALLAEVEVTPAEIAEELMRREQLEPAIRGLIGFMKGKKKEKAGQGEAQIQQQQHTPLPDTVNGPDAPRTEKQENGHLQNGSC